MMRHFALTLGLLITLGTAPSAADSDASTRGYDIAKRADEIHAGFGDSIADVTMVLTNARGATAERQMTIKSLEVRDTKEGDRSLIVFERPNDVKGSALLTHAKLDASDEQWMFMPAIKRVKRIASRNQAGPFMGSEFAYEDMTAPELEKYTYRHLRDEPCGQVVCHVLERRPVSVHSGYSRQEVWLDTKYLLSQKIHYFDRRNTHVKTLTFSQYRLYEGSFWRSHDMYMVNHKTKKTTRLVWGPYRFGNAFQGSDFSRAALKR
ncbi:MAG: outer membrane lipoprotein-sorting protein [Pseudomonadota bacterium]